jgi:nucleotidyltransferase substrate binding protein (TIGR01987 family)
MERIAERLATARQALGTLTEVLGLEQSKVVRDASIQRFEYTFEALWKAAQAYLKQQEGVEAGSPKAVVRACYQGGVLSEDQARAAMEATEDRNLSVHTYNEHLAEMIFARLPGHASLMDSWLTAMEQRFANQQHS